mgnify:FL=1|jgi:hypothetical protein
MELRKQQKKACELYTQTEKPLALTKEIFCLCLIKKVKILPQISAFSVLPQHGQRDVIRQNRLHF